LSKDIPGSYKLLILRFKTTVFVKRILLLLIITLISLPAFPQKRKTRNQEEQELSKFIEKWSEGSIMLMDKTELTGLISYEDRNGILSFKNGEESKSFTTRSVMAFEFYDEDEGRQRVFYSLDYSDPDVGVSKRYFFEVVKEYTNFAILSRTDPMEIQVATSKTLGYQGTFAPVQVAPTSYTERTRVSQTSTVYFMSAATGKITPYLRQIEGDKAMEPWTFSNPRDKQLSDKEVFAEFIGVEMFEQLEQYAKKHQLSFKRKEDFLKILHYSHSMEIF
jgi:hypothetical protein